YDASLYQKIILLDTMCMMNFNKEVNLAAAIFNVGCSHLYSIVYLQNDVKLNHLIRIVIGNDRARMDKHFPCAFFRDQLLSRIVRTMVGWLFLYPIQGFILILGKVIRGHSYIT